MNSYQAGQWEGLWRGGETIPSWERAQSPEERGLGIHPPPPTDFQRTRACCPACTPSAHPGAPEAHGRSSSSPAASLPGRSTEPSPEPRINVKSGSDFPRAKQLSPEYAQLKLGEQTAGLAPPQRGWLPGTQGRLRALSAASATLLWPSQTLFPSLGTKTTSRVKCRHVPPNPHHSSRSARGLGSD